MATQLNQFVQRASEERGSTFQAVFRLHLYEDEFDVRFLLESLWDVREGKGNKAFVMNLAEGQTKFGEDCSAKESPGKTSFGNLVYRIASGN